MKLHRLGRFADYNLGSLGRDLLSGLIVGIVAIPLGMAFAIASGVSPQYGLYTTIIAGVLISLFGGSRFQIGGPTGAFVPVLLMIVLHYGYENLLLAGMMAGVMLLLMGLFKLGALIRFIPRPVTLGFTAGIAVIIFTGQIPGFLGMHGLDKHERFLPNMKEIATNLPLVDGYSIATALVSLTVILLVARYAPKLPALLVGLSAATLTASLLFDGYVATIGSAYGAIPSELPAFRMPEMTLERIGQLLYPAFVIAMLGSIESLLSAVVADEMTGTRHDSNRELIGQGIANVAAPLFGGIPATGAIARTATNIKSGAVSPVSGIVHGVVVLAVLLLFAPLASRIPLAGMAPVLMVVAWKMSEYRSFAKLLRTKTGDSLVLAATFLLTVFMDLTVAVTAGLVLAIALFVKRMGGMIKVDKVLPDPLVRHGKVAPGAVTEKRDCPQIRIATVEGALFFGAAESFGRALHGVVGQSHRVLLIRMGKVPMIDLTGEANLAALVREFRGAGGVVLVSGIQEQPREVLERTGLAEEIGRDRFFAHTGEALGYALDCLDKARCVGCRQFAFRECAELSEERTVCAAGKVGAPSAARTT
ncbi:SulP family inorganic anion transporter [Paenibacillaceae bacterium WGS1546]|uniref:SulP family inorganic anion transporter n=1 Tax=Cohnella sp. WGS1546 TaxID=3366810 RepID=UPI00372D0557